MDDSFRDYHFGDAADGQPQTVSRSEIKGRRCRHFHPLPAHIISGNDFCYGATCPDVGTGYDANLSDHPHKIQQNAPPQQCAAGRSSFQIQA